MFSTKSSLHTYGYLYEHEFNPDDSIDTSLVQSYHVCDDDQLRIMTYLKFNIRYILIVTTSYAYPDQQGPFSLFVEGPDKIRMKQMSMYTNINLNLII